MSIMDNIQASDTTTEIVSFIQVVVFELDKEEYALSISDVREVVNKSDITPVPDSPKHIIGIMNLRGKVIPVMDLEKRFNLIRESTVSPKHVMVVEDQKGNLVGIVVDVVREVISIPEDLVKTVPKAIGSKISTDYLKGVAVIPKRGIHIHTTEEWTRVSPTVEGAQIKGEKMERWDKASGNNRILLIFNMEKLLADELGS